MKRTYLAAVAASAVVAAVLLFMHTTAFGKPPETPGKSGFTIVVMPDTQKYSESHPQIFANQTRWIAGQVRKRNIAFVIHEGDLVDHKDSEAEWRTANDSMSILDGIVPYSVLPGNHDKPPIQYNRYFPAARYKKSGWYGGNYMGNANSYQLITAGGAEYIILNLGFCPKGDTIEWANEILKTHQQRKAIVATHGYLNKTAQRNVHACGNTKYLWDQLIEPNNNVFLVLCGHDHGQAMRADTAGNRTVYQILADYQDENNGGDGWLRLMEFIPSEGKINVKTYSPYLDRYKTDENNQFTLNVT